MTARRQRTVMVTPDGRAYRLSTSADAEYERCHATGAPFDASEPEKLGRLISSKRHRKGPT